MKELKPRIHENGIDYILVGDYYVPDWKLPEEHRPIGRWGNLHRAYLRQFCPALYSTLVLSGELHTYLTDLNEQATERCSLIIEQMAEAEGVDKVWLMACCTNRSSTVGMPNRRFLPLSFGISTRRTGFGRYEPCLLYTSRCV